MRPIFIVRLVICFLEAMQSRHCFLEIRLTPCRHRIEIHHIRTDPPITTIDVNFCSGGNMTVVFACKPIHLKDDLFRASQLSHRLLESLVADESVVDVVIISSCDTSFEADLPCGTLCILVLSRTWDRVAGPSLCRSSGWRTDPTRTRYTSCFLLYHLARSIHTCSTLFLRSSTSGMLCTVISAPRRLHSTVQFMTRLSSSFAGCSALSEEPSSSCNLPTISWVTGFPVRSSMGLGDWVGLEEPD